MILPRTDCPVCGRDTAVSLKGRVWRHDPPERDPELRSCPGSFTPVDETYEHLMLFDDPCALREGDVSQSGLF
jgi:hypothetical protein